MPVADRDRPSTLRSPRTASRRRRDAGHARSDASSARRSARSTGALFDERVPRAAVGAAALPLRRLRAALLAHEDRLRLFHCDAQPRRHGDTEHLSDQSKHRLIVVPKSLQCSVTPCPCSQSVLSLDACAKAAQDLVRNRADPRRHLARVDLLPRLVALRAEEHNFVARADVVDVGDVRREHVHADGADDRRALAADQHGAAILEPAIQAIGVTGGNDGEGRGASAREARRRSRRLSPARTPFTATTRLVSDITGAARIVDASGGGTRP